MVRCQEVIEELKLNHVFLSDHSIVFLGGSRRVVIFWLLLVINVFGLLLRPEFQISIFYSKKHLCNHLILLPRVILAHNQFRQTCEGEEVIVHNALMFYNLHKLSVKLLGLNMSIFCLVDQPGQVIWLETLSTLGKANQEIIERLFVFVLSPQVVLEVRVDLVTLVHEAQIVGEHNEVVITNLIKFLDVLLELLLKALSNAISLPPHF